jgi:hypothetical protein
MSESLQGHDPRLQVAVPPTETLWAPGTVARHTRPVLMTYIGRNSRMPADAAKAQGLWVIKHQARLATKEHGLYKCYY